jgi:integrase
MQSNVILNTELIATVSFEQSDAQFAYDAYPITQTGQKLDLTQNKCHLHPERILLNFDLVHPLLREHAKAYIADVCKRYANESLYNHFKLLGQFSFNDSVTSEEDVAESISAQMRQFIESQQLDASQKSTLRTIYGWYVDEMFPYFDEDFFDLYLDILKFGSNEGKGKDVLMEMRDRGPLTIREQKLFKQAMENINIDNLSIIELQGMVALKIGQVLGARDVQIVRLQFQDLYVSEDGAISLDLPRAKQRGYKNNLQKKRRPITKKLHNLITKLQARYEQKLSASITQDWFILTTLTPRTGTPTKKRLTRNVFQTRRAAFESVMDLDFKVTNRRLRKTFCTKLIAKGTPLKVVAELMDHSDLQQLEVYYRHTHHVAKKLNDVLKAEAAEILDVFQGKVVTPEQVSQQGQHIFAPTKDQSLHLIGSCGSATPCSLNPPLSCYGCSSLEAFEDADHKAVVEHFVEETKNRFGDSHAIEILQHDDFLKATRFVQMLENGEI